MIKIRYKILILTVILLCWFPNSTKSQVVVIANKSITAKSIDNNALDNLFTLQSNEVGSQKVKLFYLVSDNESSRKFLSVMNKNLIDLKRIWLRAKLTGNGTAPEMISSEKDLIEKVAATPNAIGFADQKSVSGEVKILLKLH